MNKLKSGTEYRETTAGIIAIRGKRELHLLGSSVTAIKKSRELLATKSFNALFLAAVKSPTSNNVAALKVS